MRRFLLILPVAAATLVGTGCGAESSAAYGKPVFAAAYIPAAVGQVLSVGGLPVCARKPVTITAVAPVNPSRNLVVTGFIAHRPIRDEIGDPPMSLRQVAKQPQFSNITFGVQRATTPCDAARDRLGDEIAVEMHRSSPGRACAHGWTIHFTDDSGRSGTIFVNFSVGLEDNGDRTTGWCSFKKG